MMLLNSALKGTSLRAYSKARSALYQAESLMNPLIELAVNRSRPRLPNDDKEFFKIVRKTLNDFLDQDIERILSGVIPIESLTPENPVKHLLRLPVMFREGVRIAQKRKLHQAHGFSTDAQEFLSEMPEYYRRNFHYQSDGYLSDRSANLYDHQVEVLFAGAADAMRRLILPPLKMHFSNPDANQTDGEGLSLLELGAGTGSATKFVRLAFPKAKIVSVDLSAPYMRMAQKNLAQFTRHDFVQANASALPFRDEVFDGVYSVFLFHELPMPERRAVLKESMRVLKSGGFHGFVDSIQKGDASGFDGALEQFPISFHEPFYKNYSEHPMEELLKEAGVSNVEAEVGFFSKVIFGKKP